MGLLFWMVMWALTCLLYGYLHNGVFAVHQLRVTEVEKHLSTVGLLFFWPLYLLGLVGWGLVRIARRRK